MQKYLIGALTLSLLASPALAQTPNDTHYEELWHLEQTEAPSAWDEETGSREIIVAVIDAGVDIDHPDLAGNMWVNFGEIEGNGIDDDGNGFEDDVNGWDFIDADADPSPDIDGAASEEAMSHGTVIAGIIGAVGNNDEGITGVAWEVSIMPIRMLDEVGAGTSTQASAAIDYAIANGADVINLSFSGQQSDPILRSAIKRAYEADLVIVAAMGNESQNTEDNPLFPVCYRAPHADWIIGVASSNDDDNRSSFSNYGSNCADISAPGEDIFSTRYENEARGYTEVYEDHWSGTSMATPVVSGAAAILLSQYPSLSPTQIRTILKLSVDPMYGPFKNKVGSGRLNIASALEIAVNYSDTEDPDTLEPGDPFTSPSFSTVYVLTEDGGRRAFINANAYFTYEDSFDEITQIEDSELSNYALSGLVLPQAEIVLVKIQSDPTVYSLSHSDDEYAPNLRAITSEEIAIGMFGEDWADYVIDIEPTFFSKFGQGDDIEEVEEVNQSIMKTRQELAELAS